MTEPCEDGCNVPLYTPPEPVSETPNDDFGGRAQARSPILGDSSDRKVEVPHRNASWPVATLIEFVKAMPFATLAPGEAWHLIEHFERALGEANSQLVAAEALNEHYRSKLLQHNDL